MELLKKARLRAFVWLRSGQMLRWILLGVLVGLFSGLMAAGFFWLLEWAKHFTFDLWCVASRPSPAGEQLFSETAGEPRRWLFFLLPAIGGLLSGLIVYSLAPEAEGHGTDAMIDAFHNQGGRIRFRVPFVKAAATIVTLATGGSAGREGPIAQIGGGIGSFVADLFKLSPHDRRLLLLAGAGGGLGAIFRAPLGGAITALEVIYREDLETDALIPTVISSITAYTVFTQIMSRVFGMSGTIFEIPQGLGFDDPRQLLFYVILGLVCVPLGVFYIRTFYFMRDRVFRPLAVPSHLKPMIGGLLVGMIGLYFPQVYSDGWGLIQEALLHGRLEPGSGPAALPGMAAVAGFSAVVLMALVALFKILATSFTISSGGSGGVFGPTLFIGAMIGGVVGLLAQQYYPEIIPDGRAFILVGMAAFFAGVAHAPLGALLMVTEMTGGYSLIAPLLLVSAVAILFNRRWSIYEKQVQNKFRSPAHLGDFTINVLEEMKVKEVFKPMDDLHLIPAGATLAQVQHLLALEEVVVLPVVKGDGEIIGVLSLDTTKPILFEADMEHVLIAEDMAVPAAHLSPEDSLYEALLEFLKHPIPGLLVVAPDQPRKILGVLLHRDLIRAYNNEILKRKEN